MSSTIHDFRDLRSALKFRLQELGLEVRMSEFTDFERRPEQGTFESCFSAIEGCDYYVLLIGGRKGSEFAAGVSVTQQEYRVAAALAKRDQIKPVIFVRAEVATALSERRTVGAALEQIDTDPTPATTATSNVLEDPEFIQGFIREVEQTEFDRLGEYGPAGAMWCYRFSNFAELADALRVNLLLQRSVRRQALLANLKWELSENLTVLCDKTHGVLEPYTRWLSSVRHNIALSSGNVTGSVPLTTQQANNVFGAWFFAPDADKLKVLALHEAILSGEFLVYDQAQRRLVASPLYEAMQRLLRAIKSYGDVLAFLRPHQATQARRGADIAAHYLLWLYAIHDRAQDTIRLSFALLMYILDPTADFTMPPLNPITPLTDEIERVIAGHPSHEDLEVWASDDVLRNLLTDERPITDDELRVALGQSPGTQRALAEVRMALIKPHLTEYQRRMQADGPEAAFHWLQAVLRDQIRR